MLKERGEHGAAYSLLKDFCEMTDLQKKLNEAERKLNDIREALEREWDD